MPTVDGQGDAGLGGTSDAGLGGARRDLLRGVALVLLGLLAGVAVWFLFFTPAGRAAKDNPRQAAADVRATVHDHPVEAVSIFLVTYVGLALLCLPVWWLQLFAGVAFGLWIGGGVCLIGSATSAAGTAALADWFAGEWFHSRVEGKIAKLRWLDETLGHNGLLVVMTIRLLHLVPFGLSNVALGLSRVTTLEVLVGTLLGNIPAVAVCVGLGTGINLGTNWRFDGAVVATNLFLLIPLALRYWRPAWFRRIGVE